MHRHLSASFLTMLLSISLLSAARPPETFAKFKQLNIERLEKNFRLKFSIPFPEERFDIDYFYKGDLALAHTPEGSVLASCPYVVGPMITFFVGEGSNAATYKPTIDASIDFTKEGELSRIFLLNSDLPDWPKSHEVPIRKEGEPTPAYLNRSSAFWVTIAEKPANPTLTPSQVKVALRLISACLAQPFPAGE